MIIIAGKSSFKLAKMWSLEKILLTYLLSLHKLRSMIWIFKNRNLIWKHLEIYAGRQLLPPIKVFIQYFDFWKFTSSQFVKRSFPNFTFFTNFNELFPAMIIIFLSYVSYKFWNYVINPHWIRGKNNNSSNLI